MMMSESMSKYSSRSVDYYIAWSGLGALDEQYQHVVLVVDV